MVSQVAKSRTAFGECIRKPRYHKLCAIDMALQNSTPEQDDSTQCCLRVYFNLGVTAGL